MSTSKNNSDFFHSKVNEGVEGVKDNSKKISSILYNDAKEEIINNIFKHRISEEILEEFKKNNIFKFSKTEEDETIDITFSAEVFTVSLDIRKSTALMSNANNRQKYTFFITSLIKSFKKEIMSYGGLIDKFTGDGILCHFLPIRSDSNSPDKKTFSKKFIQGFLPFFQELNKIFNDLYNQELENETFKKEIVGVGVDYGEVFFSAQIDDHELCAIGDPVVYACRLSSAPANEVYLNVNAYQKIIKIDNTLKVEFKPKNFLPKGEENKIVIYTMKNTVKKKKHLI